MCRLAERARDSVNKAMRLIAALVLFTAFASAGAAGEGWVRMFDGKSLAGWKAAERPRNWSVEDGVIVGRGERSHLFYMTGQCRDCEFKADVKINDGGNSGMYFRVGFEPGWPKGYEAQVNSTHTDPRRTGSLWDIKDIKEQLVSPDTWWSQHVIVKGNRIVIKVNDKVVVDYTDEENRYTEGYLALQQHDPGSVVHYKNVMMRPLPPK